MEKLEEELIMNVIDIYQPIDMYTECDIFSIILYLKNIFHESILPKEAMWKMWKTLLLRGGFFPNEKEKKGVDMNVIDFHCQ